MKYRVIAITKDGGELDDYVLASASAEEKTEAGRRGRIFGKLLLHVMEHFNDLDRKLTKGFEEYLQEVVSDE